jgi:uracil-DNA glycosylase
VNSEALRNREALHRAIYTCTRCRDLGYPVERVQPRWDPAKGRGPVHKWGMLIGQAPGIEELGRAKAVERRQALARPAGTDSHTPIAFQGRGGKRLQLWLRDAGFTDDQIRTRFLKTAVTKCWPGRDRRDRDRIPTKKEVELCSPFLTRQIRLVHPRVLIPVGKLAVNWFFPEVSRLEEVVGERYQWADGDGGEYPVICLPHPSPLSAWWKARPNQSRLERAKSLLSELRVAALA